MTSSKVSLIFPNQLFENIPSQIRGTEIFLIEEHLFFKQYNFHAQKLVFHRMTMRNYAEFLKENNEAVRYVQSQEPIAHIKELIIHLKEKGVTEIVYIDPVDQYLSLRIIATAEQYGIKLQSISNEGFINDKQSNSIFFKEGKVLFRHGDFYKSQRIKEDVLVEAGKPVGGKWTFDAENRKKYPKGQKPPVLNFPNNSNYRSAVSEIQKEFPDRLGEITQEQLYPSNHAEAKDWFEQFLAQRFYDFGSYEDAILKNETYLNHSIISPLMNAGLLSPRYVIDRALSYAQENEIPLNSLEGFIRQILGWREFIRGMYEARGVQSRTTNYWKFTRAMPDSFYDGTTGIVPVDDTIKKLLKTGYNHHIERLMILGNFMLLCELDPDAVYRWFMEMYIDAYDWVMVPNVYGMSQFADGGLFASKPYISSSNYIIKMSDYSKGEWSQVWDSLFWRFLNKYRKAFTKNPRLGMLLSTFDRMDSLKKKNLMETAEDFLQALDQ